MKRLLLVFVITAFALPNTVRAQTCANIYVFDPKEKQGHVIITRDHASDGLVAKGKAAAVQTYELPIDWSTSKKDIVLQVHALFDCSPDLESQDFVWIYFRFNGEIMKVNKVVGRSGVNSIRISDSIHVPYGTKVTMRAALVCDQPEEFIQLKKGFLEVCQEVETENGISNPVVAPEPPATSMQVLNMDRKVKIIWKSGGSRLSNFFRLERTHGDKTWEAVGFAKDDCKGPSACEYVFIDTEPPAEAVGYRIVRVDKNGTEKVLNEEARPVN